MDYTAREVFFSDGYSPRCFIRNKSYDHSLSHVQRLLEDARVDFPNLHISDVEIVIYSGIRVKGIMGIEFKPPSPIPPHYKIIDSVEPIAR